MSWEEPTADDEPLARPFLSRPDVAPGAAPSGWSGPSPGTEPGGPAPPCGRHLDRPASATRAVLGAAAARAGYLLEHPAAPAAPPAAEPPVHPAAEPPAHPAADPLGRPVADPDDVRPYLLTGGRTRSRGVAVAMETVVMSTGARPVRVFDAAGQERLRIVQLAERPCSAAEVAAWLHLPLQVALVLVSDLVAEGLLNATRVATSQSDDVHFLERLIAGVAAL